MNILNFEEFKPRKQKERCSKASNFARELLMPRKDIFKYGKELLKNSPDHKMSHDKFIVEMCKIFQVTKVQMELRLKELKIFSE